MIEVSTVLYLVVMAGAGYGIFIAGREFLTGLRSAKEGVNASGAGRGGSANRAGQSSNDQEQKAPPQNESARRTMAWHDVLGVDRGASLAEIKSAYRQKISLYHPDKVAALGEELRSIAEARTREINAAYETACKLRY